ncbi:conserved hypothetical protein (plasmid) [Borreliella finlandensis]|uniref:Uncharacterized protein n=1 Tax=Borreliella finlandensis TaxID=498741 RepID=A0A806C7Z0_9SPIR|nr:conserved hypothetical protein [Borreliella finlandensis]
MPIDLINNVNYRFREFVFNYDSKEKAISDRFKELLPISSKVFLPKNISFANSAGVPIHMGTLKN